MPLTDIQQKTAAKKFAEYWEGKGYEKGESQKFWIDLLEHVYGVENITEFITFEDQVHLDHTSFIDGFIPSTHVLIEQKGLGKDLRKGIKQSDGSVLSPFQQAKRYAAELPYSQRPRWIVTCNFSEFLVYDMEKPNGEPEQILLKDLPKEYYRLQFLVNTGDEHIKKEMEVSLQAGELVGKLYNAILKQYKNPDSPETLKSLNMLCVRLVFCLYAEDAGIFGKRSMFHDYLKQFPAKNVRKALIELFRVLDQKPSERDDYLDDDLAAFPYVNGGLFENEDIEIPNFNEEILDLLLNKASDDFDWSVISPTIFGAVFESTLNPETRRSGGMHYTSIENIHKVIDPLFLDDLQAEFAEIKEIKQQKTRETKLREFQTKLSSLKFLDPACGSGNFLTETYISLRKLENEALKLIIGDQIVFETKEVIKVSIQQFYGIEINDFAAVVAKTALWIAESQMMKETEEIIHAPIDFLPLKSYTNITLGNALRVDWESVVPKDELDYIMGNPPFVGTKYQSKGQKEDILQISSELKCLDYVTGWYKKAVDIMRNTKIECAFVSTNSITQGEQVAPLWKLLHTHINFAHRTFRWDSEANIKAHVHCVIIGFSDFEREEKAIYDNGIIIKAHNINGYLIDAPDVFIEARKNPICSNVQKMIKGSQPTDGGNLLLNDDERKELIQKNPLSEKYIKRYMGANDLINNAIRYCLWLVDVSPNELRRMPEVMKRLDKVKESRLSSKKAATQKWADKPYLFTENRQPNTDYLILPVVSSENRKYIPVCYVTKDVIANANAQMIPNANLYTFGIINSNVHNAWLRAICGRMKSDYAYSATIVYNNFPWPDPTPEQKAAIEKTAQAILDARALYPDCSLADLYDELTMPPELRKAHHANDFAVMAAYGFDKKISESECVAELMRMYREMTEGHTDKGAK